jgi:DnaJ like chaperone protein
MGAVKWIGGVLGWSVGGVIGGIMGYALGSLFDQSVRHTKHVKPQTQPGDFGVSLLILSAAVMKSDNQVLKTELDFVKKFFVRQFGQEKAANYILTLRELLKQDYSVRDVCQEIRMYMDHASRLQLMHFLYGLSMSDGHSHPSEIQIIRSIANWLGISQIDQDSIQAMFVKTTESAYKILEIDPNAPIEEIKKAYKRMAIKHHPDKVSHLGPDVQAAANEKFKQVNAAYDTIKKERNFS